MDKEKLLSEVKNRLSEKAKAHSCILMLNDRSLDNEPLMKELLAIEGSKLEFNKKINKFKFTLESKIEGYGYTINDHLRSIASSCSTVTGNIKALVNKGVFGSITYLGMYENGEVIGEIIDPDVSEFLSNCKLPLHIHYGRKV